MTKPGKSRLDLDEHIEEAVLYLHALETAADEGLEIESPSHYALSLSRAVKEIVSEGISVSREDTVAHQTLEAMFVAGNIGKGFTPAKFEARAIRQALRPEVRRAEIVLLNRKTSR